MILAAQTFVTRGHRFTHMTYYCLLSFLSGWFFVDGNDLVGNVQADVCALTIDGSLAHLEADCPDEIECTFCTKCCSDNAGCVDM